MKPELMISGLNKRLAFLLNKASLFNDKALENKLQSMLRETLILELLSERYIIAVSGLQGVGKSTLIKNLYDLPEGILPAHLNRGEKLPILVCEGNVKQTQKKVFTFVRSSEKNTSLIAARKCQENFIEIVQNPGRKHILLEITVPKRYFKGENFGFLLLPGIEKSGVFEDEHWWVSLAKSSLKASANSILAVNHSKLASKENDDVIELMVEHFKSAKPIIACTFADQRDSIKEAELHRQVAKKFDITKKEIHNRIISTGKGKEWKKDLIRALFENNTLSIGHRTLQLENLNRSLRDSLPIILNDTKLLLNTKKIDSQSNRMDSLEPILEEYDKAVESLRREYSSLLTKSLTQFSTKPLDSARAEIIEGGLLEKIRKSFFRSPINKELELEDLVKRNWDDANGLKYDRAYLGVLSKLINRRISRSCPLLENVTPENSGNVQRLLGNFSTDSEADNMLDEAVLNDLRLFCSPTFKGENTEFSRNLKKSVSLVPVLALEFIRLTCVVPNLAAYLHELKKKERKDVDILEQISLNFQSIQGNSGKILFGMASMLGIDVAVDGKIDVFPAILSALGANTTPMMLAIVNASLGVAAHAVVLKGFWNEIVAEDFEEMVVVRQMITNIKNNTDHYLKELFDDMMRQMRYRLELRLREYFNVDSDYARIANCQKALGDVVEYCAEMRGVLNENKFLLA